MKRVLIALVAVAASVLVSAPAANAAPDKYVCHISPC